MEQRASLQRCDIDSTGRWPFVPVFTMNAPTTHVALLRPVPTLAQGSASHLRPFFDSGLPEPHQSTERRHVARGAALFRKGEIFNALYVVWAGSFKLCGMTHQGQAQVTGFAMRGDWIGLEGIAERVHEGEAVALEDSQVWVLPFVEGQADVAIEWPPLLHHTMSRELSRRQATLLLAHRSAEVRVASFLLDLSDRAAAHGYSPIAIVLRMSRADIGSCLGLSLETVSRTFSSLKANGLLQVNSRQLRITDAAALQRLCGRAA
jgi:CRP/FNR family transcriptional regulator